MGSPGAKGKKAEKCLVGAELQFCRMKRALPRDVVVTTPL